LPIEPVVKWIKERNVKWRLIVASSKTATVRDAARLLGVDSSRIVKTLIVVAGDKTYAVIIPGDKKRIWES